MVLNLPSGLNRILYQCRALHVLLKLNQKKSSCDPGPLGLNCDLISKSSSSLFQEGFTKLWTGLGPNVARNAIINAAELASYDQIKQVRCPATFRSKDVQFGSFLYF